MIVVSVAEPNDEVYRVLLDFPGRWSNGMTAESHSANRGSIPRRSIRLGPFGLAYGRPLQGRVENHDKIEFGSTALPHPGIAARNSRTTCTSNRLHVSRLKRDVLSDDILAILKVTAASGENALVMSNLSTDSLQNRRVLP